LSERYCTVTLADGTGCRVMRLAILGIGCTNCTPFATGREQAARAMAIDDSQVVRVTDYPAVIASVTHDLMSTLA
jgi:hypothetical protein